MYIIKTCFRQRPLKSLLMGLSGTVPNCFKSSLHCRTVDRRGNISFEETVTNHVQQRGDEWGRDVAFRT